MVLCVSVKQRNKERKKDRQLLLGAVKFEVGRLCRSAVPEWTKTHVLRCPFSILEWAEMVPIG